MLPKTLTLLKKTQLTHDVWELVYEASTPFFILPGQFLLCDCDANNSRLKRSYSVSWVSWDHIHFIIKRVVDGGGGSIAICDQEIGHQMQVWWPMGRFTLKSNSSPKVFIGTGTGFAPLYFMMKTLIQQMKNEEWRMKNGGIIFLFWVRELRDVFYVDQLENWRNSSPFDYEIFCSRENGIMPPWKRGVGGIVWFSEKHHHGRVTDYMGGHEWKKNPIEPPCQGGNQRGVGYMKQDFSHIPYSPELVDYAREQRQTESLAEKRMWYDVLKEKKLKQYKFTRQKPLLNYIADFYCSELGLIIEVDGDDHEGQKEYDEKRTKDLEEYGLKVLRFHNLRAMEEVPTVEKEILEWIEKRKAELLNPPAFSHPPWQGGSTQLLFYNPDTEYYICGSPAMVTEVRWLLAQNNISEDKVFFEQY